jgi:hypothetical protein
MHAGCCIYLLSVLFIVYFVIQASNQLAELNLTFREGSYKVVLRGLDVSEGIVVENHAIGI